MRPVSVAMHRSLDGFVAGPRGELDWIFDHVDDALTEAVLDYLSSVDTMLLGRATYVAQAAVWPTRDGPIAEIVNRHEKVVFSSRLAEAEWSNARIANRPAAEEIARLRRQHGGTIGVAGGATFASGLLREGLVDELRLTTHPVLLGQGLPLTTSPAHLELVDSQVFATGAITTTYRRREGT